MEGRGIDGGKEGWIERRREGGGRRGNEMKTDASGLFTSAEFKHHYLCALSYLLQWIPKQVLLSEVPNVSTTHRSEDGDINLISRRIFSTAR